MIDTRKRAMLNTIQQLAQRLTAFVEGELDVQQDLEYILDQVDDLVYGLELDFPEYVKPVNQPSSDSSRSD